MKPLLQIKTYLSYRSYRAENLKLSFKRTYFYKSSFFKPVDYYKSRITNIKHYSSSLLKFKKKNNTSSLLPSGQLCSCVKVSLCNS